MDLVPIPSALLPRRDKLTSEEQHTFLVLERRRDAQALMRLLADDRAQESARFRRRIVQALGRSRDRAATQTVIRLVREDPDLDIRVGGMYALGSIGDPASARFILETLERTDDDRIRMNALEALVKVSPGEALTPLIAALDNTSPWVRVMAANQLDNLDDRAAIPALEAAKRRTWNPLVRSALWVNIARMRKRDEASRT